MAIPRTHAEWVSAVFQANVNRNVDVQMLINPSTPRRYTGFGKTDRDRKNRRKAVAK